MPSVLPGTVRYTPQYSFSEKTKWQRLREIGVGKQMLWLPGLRGTLLCYCESEDMPFII